MAGSNIDTTFTILATNAISPGNPDCTSDDEVDERYCG
jgi:hypothetical protein